MLRGSMSPLAYDASAYSYINELLDAKGNHTYIHLDLQ